MKIGGGMETVATTEYRQKAQFHKPFLHLNTCEKNTTAAALQPHPLGWGKIYFRGVGVTGPPLPNHLPPSKRAAVTEPIFRPPRYKGHEGGREGGSERASVHAEVAAAVGSKACGGV